ncbi:MAG: sulfite exporter TauE/SafE family protein [Desulfobulbaceae bacterium]|nr:sulfite exporter TauE/SafE family protein [Desulfobulbaceae bacterium]
MKRSSSLFMVLLATLLYLCFPGISVAVEAELTAKNVKAGDPITVKGTIAPGRDLYIVICTESTFKPSDAIGVKERKKLLKQFESDPTIPPNYYVVTNAPDGLAVAKEADKGQTKGIFAFPPFKYKVRVNKIKKWADLSDEAKGMLGPVTTEAEWNFLTYTHENKFGINTVSKERPVGGGNAKMILSDYNTRKEAWNNGVRVQLDKGSGKFTVAMVPYRNIAPDTKMSVYVNGEKIDTLTIDKSGYFFSTGNTYMNPLLVTLGAFIIGVLFVIMGAAGGLFTAAFQITVVGTKGPLGINAANTIKPTNLFLTLCSPITGLINYFKENRFAWPVAVCFAIGIVIGAFFLGPAFSAKYLPLKAYKFYLGIVCLVIGVKLFWESLPGSIEKKKAMKAIIQKFNLAVKEAKGSGKAVELGKVEFEKFNFVRFDMQFWGETFVARPLVMLIGGVIMGMVAASFGVGGGFMFMPFMTTIMGYPMYLAVPIALAGTFATSIGGIAKYILMGYSPDWMMAICIAAGAIGGGMVGPKIQKKLPEIFLKRMLALALIIVFMKYTQLLVFLR